MIDLVLSALAAFRLSRLLYDDMGPFNIIQRFRLWLYRQRNPVVEEIGETIACPYCSGLWFSALFILPTLMQANKRKPPKLLMKLLVTLRAVLAVAGLQEIIESRSRRD